MPTATNFDTLFPAELTGNIVMEIFDSDNTPNRVLDIAQNWKIVVDWYLDGPFACTLAGTWELRAMVESMGIGTEGQVGPTITKDLITNRQPGSTPTHCHYHGEIFVTAGVISQVGVYKVVSLVTYKDSGAKPRPMAGFAEFPLITFYADE